MLTARSTVPGAAQRLSIPCRRTWLRSAEVDVLLGGASRLSTFKKQVRRGALAVAPARRAEASAMSARSLLPALGVQVAAVQRCVRLGAVC